MYLTYLQWDTTHSSEQYSFSHSALCTAGLVQPARIQDPSLLHGVVRLLLSAGMWVAPDTGGAPLAPTTPLPPWGWDGGTAPCGWCIEWGWPPTPTPPCGGCCWGVDCGEGNCCWSGCEGGWGVGGCCCGGVWMAWWWRCPPPVEFWGEPTSLLETGLPKGGGLVCKNPDYFTHMYIYLIIISN